MIRFVVFRIFYSFIALIGIIIIVFFLVRLSGDPMSLLSSPNLSEEQYEHIKERLGLDKSWGEQFIIYMGDLAQGDFGESLLRERPVIEMIGKPLLNTLKLILPSFFIAMLLSVFLGVLGATKRDTIWDNGVKFLAVLGQALPGFWVAIMAVLIFSVYLGWLPVAGDDTFLHYILPVATMVFFMLPGMMRLVRSSMLDVLDSEYIKLARIKGLPERTVIWKHGLRNALITPLTVAGMIFAMMITGAVITEQVFNWPGLGRMIIESTFSRDFPVVQAITILTAIFVLGINLLVDILYAYIDPQFRYQKL
jgi:ABC-type dipeptide/oligopeptide/nickel transport system permease component